MRPTSHTRRLAAGTATALGLTMASAVVLSTPATAALTATTAATDLYISEYVEGSSNNKALEIFNGTAGTVDLAAGGYKIAVYANGAATATSTIALTGTIAAGGTFVVANSSASTAIVAQLRSGSVNFNGNDAVALIKGTAALDVIGQIGVDPGTEWGTGVTSTMDNTLRRKSTVTGGDSNGSDAFDPATQWDGFAIDTFDGLGKYPDSTGGGTPEPGACGDPFATIPSIQGSGDTVALTGAQSTEGVVVADDEGPSPALRGFFIQDPTGDGDPATSDGLFVFEGSNLDTVKIGDRVRVTGTAGENQGQSQISASTIQVCGTGTVAPTDVTFPVASPTFLERYEGMLVRLPQQMSVTEHFQLGRFGQVTLSQGGRLAQPTNVVSPGAQANALQASNNLRKIILDDGSQTQNPDPIVFARGGQPLSASNTLRGGDTTTGLTGVLTYTWGGNSASPNAYRIRPINAMGGVANFVAANARPAASPTINASTRVVGMNLLNFFNSFTGCTGGTTGAAMDCRGAESQTEFDRQIAKTVAAVSGTKADVVAFMEMENDGYGPSSAEATLVSALNTKDGAGTWAFINPDSATGQIDSMGSDAIKVGFLYKPAQVTPVGTTAVLNSADFVNAGTDSPKNRPSLAQAFRDNGTGGVFVGVANHLKSKGSGCGAGGAADDTGDGQGNCNAARTYAAGLLTNWLSTDPTKTGDSDVLILGDLNSYAMEDPITTIKGAGFRNLIQDAHGDAAYSYVFDGQWGYLDHALGSASLASQVAGVEDWHINADEPSVLDYNTNFKTAGQLTSLYAPDEFRISDHDPVVVGLNLTAPAPFKGVATGGGWYTSPAGAIVSSPSTTGKALYSFDVGFRAGAKVPTGSVAVDLPDGTHLATTGLRWMSKTGSTVTFAGDGTYAGKSGYTIEAAVTDNGKTGDTVDVIVRDSSGTVVYDSRTQAAAGNITVR